MAPWRRTSSWSLIAERCASTASGRRASAPPSSCSRKQPSGWPTADGRDLAGLLQRAGFALPVVDTDRIPVTYSSPLALMAELRAMGETNALRERRRRFTRRTTLLRAAEVYRALAGTPDG